MPSEPKFSRSTQYGSSLSTLDRRSPPNGMNVASRKGLGRSWPITRVSTRVLKVSTWRLDVMMNLCKWTSVAFAVVLLATADADARGGRRGRNQCGSSCGSSCGSTCQPSYSSGCGTSCGTGCGSVHGTASVLGAVHQNVMYFDQQGRRISMYPPDAVQRETIPAPVARPESRPNPKRDNQPEDR